MSPEGQGYSEPRSCHCTRGDRDPGKRKKEHQRFRELITQKSEFQPVWLVTGLGQRTKAAVQSWSRQVVGRSLGQQVAQHLSPCLLLEPPVGLRASSQDGNNPESSDVIQSKSERGCVEGSLSRWKINYVLEAILTSDSHVHTFFRQPPMTS